MEYSADFRLIQSAMNHCNEFVKKFDKILFYGGTKTRKQKFKNLISKCLFSGNEVYINEITARLQNIFRCKGYTDSVNCQQLRKILLLLMLNTDVSLSRDLKDDAQVCHLLNNFPQLSPCLFVNLVWQLKLESYFYESLKYSPSWFVLQFLPETIDSLRFSKPLDVVSQVKEIIESLYHNICRMDYKIVNADQQIEKKIIITKLLEHIMSLLRNYNTPDTDDDIAKSKNKFQEYLGHSTNLQLSLVVNCFEMFLRKPSFTVAEEVQIFKVMAGKEREVDNFSATSYSPVVHEALSTINMALLNTLQNSVVNIKLDDFMYWVEIDIEDNSTDDDDLKCDNIQKSVGMLSFKLIELISKNDSFQHNVIDQLQTISIRPKTLEEIASEATVGTILQKIEQSPNRRVWFEELLNRPEILYTNAECLQTVIECIDIVTCKDLMRILKDMQAYEDMEQEDEKLLKEILRAGASRLSKIELRDVIEEIIRVFGVDYNLSCDEADDAAQTSEITNYCNKLTETNLLEDQLWKLILVNPSKFFTSLLKHVVQQDKSQIVIALNILGETNSIAVDYVENIVQESLETAASSSKSQYHVFLVGLFKLKLIDSNKFIKDVLITNLAAAMSMNALKLIAMLLVTLKQLSAKLKIDNLLVPLTVLVAQILDKYRWDLKSYSQLNETIVETSIEIIHDFVKTILVNGTPADKQFVVSKIQDCKPMTRYYFQKFSLEKGEAINTFDKFLQPSGFDDVSKNSITNFLCGTIVRCTNKEFKWLMLNEKLQALVIDALLVVAVIVDRSKQQETTNCLHKCVSDFAKILKASWKLLVLS